MDSIKCSHMSSFDSARAERANAQNPQTKEEKPTKDEDTRQEQNR